MFGNQPSPYSRTRSSTRGPVPPIHTGSGLCTGLGHDQMRSKSTNSPWKEASSLRPDLAHGQRALAHDAKARGRVGAVVAHLLEVPAGADAELEAPAREVVERGGLVGQRDRVALDDQRDAGADAQALGGGRDRAERDERVERVRVLARQLVAARPRALAAGGDVRVLGDEDRVEAGVLGGAAERDGRDRLVGDEHRQAELHGATSGARSPAGGRRPARGRPAASRARCRSARRPWPAASGARRGSRRPGSTSTWAASAGKPEVTSQTCRSWTSTTPGMAASAWPTACGSTPSGAPSSSTRPASRSSSQPERSMSAATSSEAMASARSKPVRSTTAPAVAAASDAKRSVSTCARAPSTFSERRSALPSAAAAATFAHAPRGRRRARSRRRPRGPTTGA